MAVEKILSPSEAPLSEFTIPTSETAVVTYLMKASIRAHHIIRLIGLAGCGKTKS